MLTLISKVVIDDSRFSLRLNAAIREGQGVTEMLHSEYKWRRCAQLFVVDHKVCECCGENHELQVHHVVPWHISVELRFEPSNFIALCQACHFRFGHLRNWKDSNPEIRVLCEQVQEIRSKHEELKNVA